MASQRKGMNCAECRRSKLKCDRKVPCSSCVKRGCPNICPDGMQAATKGMKLIAAQEENSALKSRIQFLEQAIRKLQNPEPEIDALDSNRCPPPGEGPYYPTKRFLDSSERSGGDLDDMEEPDSLDAFGNLTVGEEGGSTFHGRLAHTEYLLNVNKAPGFRSQVYPSNLPHEILHLTECFPFGPRTPPDASLKALIVGFIPNPALTWHMYETFKGGTSWLNEPVPRREFLDQIYSHIHPTGGPPEPSSIHPHRLSVLFMIAAIATLFDKTKEKPVAEAEEWHNLATASISLQSIFEEPTIMGVQALFLMVIYNYAWDRNGSEKRWFLMGLVSKMVLSIGLHKDSARWKLDPAEVQRRRWMFWDIACYDAWMSFVYGRPPSFSIKHTDCLFPEDPEAVMNSQGKPEHTFHTWKHRYTVHCLLPATEIFGSSHSTYVQILKMDRAIRKCPLSTSLSIPGLNNDTPDPNWAGPLRVALQRFAVLVQRESNLLLIHRAHFAQAMDETAKTNDLFHSKYTPSVLAVYRSSCLLIAGLRDFAKQHHDVVRRQWFFWTGPFTAGIVLASLIIRCTKCNLAHGALPSLDALVELFETVQPMFAPDNALDLLKKLQMSAHKAIDRIKGASDTKWDQEDLEIELPLLDGRTRLISRKRSAVANLPMSYNSSISRALESTAFVTAFGDVHPSVLAYFRALDPPSPLRSASEEATQPSPGSQQSSLNLFPDKSDFWSLQWNPGAVLPPDPSFRRTTHTKMDGVYYQPSNDTLNAAARSSSMHYYTPSPSDTSAGSNTMFPVEASGYNGLADEGTTWNTLMDQLGVGMQVPSMNSSGNQIVGY